MWCRTCSKATDREQSLMILEKLLPQQYSHTVCSYGSLGDVNFRASLKLKLSREEEAKRWFEDFQSSSGLTWRTSKTYPNVGRYNKYRVDYRCRTIKRNTSCPATLFLILKRKQELGERKSRSGDPHMKEGLFLHVNLRNEHNHRGPCAQAMKRKDVSVEAIEKLKKLFEVGHSPTTALDVLKYDLQKVEQDNYVYAAADRSVCPDLQFCYRLYYKLFKKVHGAAAGAETFKDLGKKLDEYNKEREDVCARMCQTDDNQLVIAICTPMMRRVHARLRESGEMVFVDSSGNCDRHNHHLYLLVTPSSAGSLPLGVFITTSKTQQTISAALKLLQTVFPPDRFFSHPDGPFVVATGDCAALRQALTGAFPKATLVHCVSTLFQAMWRWLWSSSNGVPKQHKPHLLKYFRDLLCASTPEALMEVYTRLMVDDIALQHTKFVRHVQEVYKRREEWAQLPTRGNHTNDYAGSAFGVVKEKLLYRLKAYSVTQLVDFVFTRLEAHYIHRLTGAPSNNLRKVMKKEDIWRDSVVQEDQDNYTVASTSNAEESHHVNTAIGCCTCPAGIHGGHCDHQSAVARTFGHSESFLHDSTPDTRKLYYQIATGEDIADECCQMLDKPSLPERAAGIGYTCCHPATGELSLKERLHSIFVDISKRLDNPDFTHPITSFVRTYESIKTDSAMVSALSSFGKNPQSEAGGCKRQRDWM